MKDQRDEGNTGDEADERDEGDKEDEREEEDEGNVVVPSSSLQITVS